MLPGEIARRVKGIEIRTRKLVEDLFGGEYHSVFKGRGMEFDEVREYMPGDDIRSIDWNVTARAGHPYIKKFSEERELTLLLVVDHSASGAFGTRGSLKAEKAAEACALLAFSAIRNNDRVGLLSFTDRIELYVPPRKGKSHVLRLIRELLYFEPEGTKTDVSVALEFAARVLNRRSLVFLVSDLLSSDFEKTLRIAGRKHDLTAMQIIDPAEMELPDAGIITMEDAESGEMMLVDTSSRAVRESWARNHQEAQKNLENLMRRCDTDHILLRTDENIDLPLKKFFKTRERRRKRGRRHAFIPGGKS